METILEKIKNQPISISQWVSGFIGILFIRFILEALSSPTRSGLISSNSTTLVHYGLFWIALTLGLIIIVGSFSKNYLFSSKLALFALPVIWIAPVIDIVISRGEGFIQSYILDSGYLLFIDFITFFGPNISWGATYGIRIEMLFVLIGFGWYLRKIGKKWLHTILGVICVYSLGFLVASWPGILYTVTHLNNTVSTLPDIYRYFGDVISKSTISHNLLYEGISSVSLSRFVELGFDKLASQILFIFACVLSALLFWKIDPKKFQTILRNIRLERISSYLALLLCGVGFAYISDLGRSFVWVDAIGLICLMVSWTSIWMYAVHSNDIADIEIDKISNTSRPLVKKEVVEEEMKETGYIWLATGLLGAWCAGFYPFYMSLVYLFASHIYSAPPLRLRRFPIVSSSLIGVASLATVLAGFFFISITKQIDAFPILLSVGILIMVTLAINVKDMKDIEGDRANEIMTIPVIFKENGPKVVALFFALSFLLVPIFLSFYFLYIIAIPTAFIGYRLVMKKPYKEEPIFVLRFIFLGIIALIYLGILFATRYS